MAQYFAVLNRKGGSTKTTSAAFIAHVLHETGLRTLGVDADPENENLVRWQDLADWDFPVIGMPVPSIHRQLPGVVGDNYDVVVLDTPPMMEHRSIVSSVARLATHIVIPVAPSTMEYDGLERMRELLEEIEPLRQEPPVVAVLFTRTVPNASSTETFRELIPEKYGLPVLKPTVGRLERFAQAFGSSITNATNTAYGDAVSELLTLEPMTTMGAPA